MKLSGAEQISLAISLIGTALSAFSFFHTPTVVAKVLPQKNSQNSLNLKLTEISQRLDKLEAISAQVRRHPAPELSARSQPRFAVISHQPIEQQLASKALSPATESPTNGKPETQPNLYIRGSSSLPLVSTKSVLKSPSSPSKFRNTQTEVTHSVQQREKQLQQQQIPAALQQLQQAWMLDEQTGDRLDEATVLGKIATLYDQLGQYPEADNLLQQALALLK